MTSRVLTIVLATGLFFSALYLATKAGTAHIPGNQQDYQPVQPIAYSHRLHAGELQMPRRGGSGHEGTAQTPDARLARTAEGLRCARSGCQSETRSGARDETHCLDTRVQATRFCLLRS